MANASNKVTLLYDPISPWSYVALVLLKRFQKEWRLDLTLQPVCLGYVFQAAGNRAPLVVPNKGNMMAQEFKMFADMYKIPTSPEAWTYSKDARSKPPNSLPLARFLMVLQENHPELLEAVTTKVFEAIFAKGDTALFSDTASGNIDHLYNVIGQVSSSNLSKENISSMLQKSNSKEFKEKPKPAGKRYVEEWGVYGVPWMRVTKGKTGEVKDFMGSDRFELIAHWLEVPYNGSERKSKL